MTSIDLKDAYFLIPIHNTHKKYLRFQYNSVLYEFNCLPFGLCTAPFVFTKLLKPVMEYLRMHNMLSVIYLDDILCIGCSYTECKNNTKFTSAFLKSLGFILNNEKSSLTPSKNCKFLGFLYNSKHMTLTLPDDKKTKIIDVLNKFIKTNSCQLREFARFLGLLVSACPALLYSWLYTKEFERFKFTCLLDNPSYDQIIQIPKHLKSDMLWWLNNIHSGFYPLNLNRYDLEIYSDASTSGWGAWCDTGESFGYWKNEEKLLHINELELRAAFLALKCFATKLSHVRILLRIDNVTAISCINKMGSIQFRHLNCISREIWQWCEKRKITIFASYINTKDNYEADFLSRKKFQDTEWELNDYAFDEITQKYGFPKIDLFASRCNAKCPIYITWKTDPEAFTVDAFTISWRNRLFYAFPPFSLVTKMLHKIVNDKAEGIVVVPYWPSQPWFPLFQRLLDSDPIYFEPDVNLLTSPFRMTHNLYKTLRLVAAKLSGRHY